jgi:hypothetical protein
MKHNDHIEDKTTTTTTTSPLMQSNEDEQPEGFPINQRVNQIPNETFFLM